MSLKKSPQALVIFKEIDIFLNEISYFTDKELMKLHKFYFLFCAILFLLALPITGKTEPHENIKFYHSVLGNINNNANSYVCDTLVHEQKSCSHLFNLFERDRSTGMFFGLISDSPWETCKKYIPASKEISLNELEKKLSEHNRTSLGLRNNYFSSKFEECLPKKYKRNDKDVEAQSKIVVTMGYDYLNRIKKSTGQLTEEIKTLNSIIGDPIDTGIPCGQFTMPQDAKICADIKAERCKSLNELNLYTDTLYENAIEPMIALKSSYKSLSDGFSKTRTLRRPANQEILKDLSNKIKSLESQFPILKGKTLGPFLAKETDGGKIPSKSKLQNAVKAQLVENRTNLSKKLDENVDMNNCLVYGDEKYCKKFEDNFERVPPREDVTFFERASSPANRLKNLAASELYSTNQCIDNFRGLKNEFNSFAADFSINVGLTVFTGGTGLLLRTGGTGVKLALAGHKAMLVADAAFLGAGVDEAIKTCSIELNKLESLPSDKSVQTNVCPASLAKPEHIVVANYQGCMTGAMMASLNALPFVPAAVSKYLSRVKAPKNSVEVSSELSSLFKFKSPKKAFDSHDLRSAGTILPAGKVQDPSALFKRDGVYVYIVDDKGNMVLSHRTPDLSAGTKEGDQFLGTHRGLYNKLAEKGSDIGIVSAGEIRVVGGFPIRVSPRAGSFHNTSEEILANMKQFSSNEDKKMIDKLQDEYRKLSASKADSMTIEMHMEDFLDDNPAARAVYEKMQKQATELADKRLEVAKEAMSSRGILPKEVDTKFTRDVGGDAHIEGRAAAVAEIDCNKNKSCSDQLDSYQKLAQKFIGKFKGPDQSEMAVLAKLVIKDIKGLSAKERAFQFFGQRSYLLFKEGPIEFIKNGKPESYGLTGSEALKYLDEWSKQF